MWIPLVLALVYAGVTILMRGRADRAIEEEAARKQADADRAVVERLGGGEMKVLTFYASPPAVARGEKTLLCYGVASAKTVTLEPDVEQVAPSLSRCVEVHPKGNTQYKLTATDARGRVETRTVDVKVR